MHIYLRLMVWLSMYFYAPYSLSANTYFQQSEIFQPPPTILLTKSDQALLQQARPVFKQFASDQDSQQVIVFRVSAPAKNIWQTITAYESYPRWVKGVDKIHIYKQDQNNYFVDFVISHWLLGTYKYSVWHYLSNDGWMKWQLDQNKPSDFSRSQGFWRVAPVAHEFGANDVYYSADLRFNPPKSNWLRRKIIKAGLKQASLWVKREAENNQ